MVITNKKYISIQKSVLPALSFVLFMHINTLAQQNSTLLGKKPAEIYLKLIQFNYRFADIPSLINQANIKTFNIGEISYLYAQGKLRHPQDYKKRNGLALSIESLGALKNTRWTFNGRMDYKNIQKADVEANLSYGFQKDCSPYYFFQQVKGLWNHQNYKFILNAANRLTSKLTVGIHFTYDNNSYFRKIDTRNETLSLTIKTGLSATYNLNTKQTFSISANFLRTKTDSELANKFKQVNTKGYYTIYLNTGLGYFLKNTSKGARTIKIMPKFQIHWLYKEENSDFSVHSQTFFGKEKWLDKNVYLVNQIKTLSEYKVLKQNFYIQYNKFYGKKIFQLNFKLNYLKGNGKYLNNTSWQYVKNYKVNKNLIRMKIRYIKRKSFFNNIGFGINYGQKQQNDLNYAYTMYRQFIKPEVSLGLSKTIKKIGLFTKFESNYLHILNFKHQPFAADNLFVTRIGNRIADYAATSKLNFKNTIQGNIPLKNNNALEIQIDISYLIVTTLSAQIPKFIGKNHDFLDIKCGLKWYF